MSRILIALMWAAHFLPARLLAVAGDAIGTAAFWLIRERRQVTRINLAKCFPGMDAQAREALARSHFRSFCRALLDRAILWWGSRERIERLVRIEGLENLRALQGAPALLLVPHFAGLDAGLMRLVCETRVAGIYANPKNRVLGDWLRRGRGRFGNLQQISRQEGVRAGLPWIRKGWPFYYLPDQDYGPRGALFVPFFGVQAATMPGLSRIARLTGAKVLPCVTRMLGRGAGYVLTIEPPWDNFPTQDLAADTRRMNEYIERRVLEMPEQYLWMHKRFKTRPPGEACFY
ncbi:MAG TPA: lipid A biosynthesis acyltransferase [Burkholderiales bacterium]|jgi:KDO2-lipid IV(A) lauroyltransferase|nr:lipid A biosynthesis acyltransferase [Burkholderiales bacterium]